MVVKATVCCSSKDVADGEAITKEIVTQVKRKLVNVVVVMKVIMVVGVELCNERKIGAGCGARVCGGRGERGGGGSGGNGSVVTRPWAQYFGGGLYVPPT